MLISLLIPIWELIAAMQFSKIILFIGAIYKDQGYVIWNYMLDYFACHYKKYGTFYQTNLSFILQMSSEFWGYNSNQFVLYQL